MGFLDKLRGKATEAKEKVAEAVDQHGPKIGEAVDKAKEFVDEKTGGRFGDKDDAAAEQAKDALDDLDGRNDDIP